MIVKALTENGVTANESVTPAHLRNGIVDFGKAYCSKSTYI